MDSRSRFLHRTGRVCSDGGTRRGKDAARNGQRALAHVGGPGRQTPWGDNAEVGWEGWLRDQSEGFAPEPPRKASSEWLVRPYRKPTLVDWQNTAKVNGRTFAKELGNMTP
jgi:hypothetical protein